jgi:hypothetical protein
VVTLVAAVPGVKGFDNFGEPFVDKNDNGVRDADEPFIDYNGNGKYDGPNGQLQDHMVWKSFRVIWSGAANVPPSGGGALHYSYFTQDSNNHARITSFFLDQNLNDIAADGPAGTDSIEWSATCGGGSADGTFVAPDIALDQSNPGILFSADTGAISAPGNRGTYTQVSTTNVISSQTGDLSAQTCTVTATPHRCNDPGAPGYDAQCEGTDNGLVGGFSF